MAAITHMERGARLRARLEQAAQLAREFPDLERVFDKMALDFPDVELDDVADFARSLAGMTDDTIYQAVWRTFDPELRHTRSLPEQRKHTEKQARTFYMAAEEFLDHLLVLSTVHADTVDLRKITPANVLAVRCFLAKSKGAPRAVVMAALANPDALLELSMGAVDLPTFADVLPHLPDEVRERYQ